MILMVVALEGSKVETTHWLIRNLREIQDAKSDIDLGMLVTFFAQKLNVELDERDKEHLLRFGEANWLNAKTLHRVKLIIKNGKDEWSLVGGDREQGHFIEINVPTLSVRRAK